MGGRLGDERRDELMLASNYFGEQAVRAFLDGAMDVALASSDRAIRDHEVLYRDDPTDREVVAVLADLLRDRAELRRHAVLAMIRAGRWGEAQAGARTGVADGERAIELREAVTEAPDPHPLWVASARLVVAELQMCASRSGDARREVDLAIADHRRAAEPGNRTSDDDRATLDLAHALLRYADLLADQSPDVALAARRESVELARLHLGVGGRLWQDRHWSSTTWASTPTLRLFSGSAHDLALVLGPPGRAAAREALLALHDAIQGYTALFPATAVALGDPQVRDDLRWLEASVGALRRWLDVVDGSEVAAAYAAGLERLVGEPDADRFTELDALRSRLTSHLDRAGL